MLYLVSTPIGNLEDMTLRAIRILREVDFICCEDTRTSGKLLRHYEIDTSKTSYHSHSSTHKVDAIIKRITNGESAALISDAGTPGISDPGYALIQAAIAADIQISPIPGANALLSALTGSGMHMHDFRYIGFLPIKKGRKTLLEKLASKDYTAVIYESPHRIVRTLGDLEKTFGHDHSICVARELTKIHETYHRGTITQIREACERKPMKGEMVVVF